jgi:hypothetical protein
MLRTKIKNQKNNEAAETTEPAGSKQKRDHFRLDCKIPAITKLIQKNHSVQIVLGTPNPALINNLSGGGVKLMTNMLFKEKDRVLVTFKLDDDLIVMTSVVKFRTKSPSPEYTYQYGLMFRGAAIKDRDIICKYLFKEQMSSFS